MASPLRIGIVGCGRATMDLHLPALVGLRGLEAVAVADVDAARAQEAATRFGIRRTYDDPAELAAAADVELVAVCSPPATHAEVALTALAAGRHVFVEKPLTLDVAEADALVEAADGRVGAMGFNMRVHRQVAAAREVVASGRLGRLRMVRTHWIIGPRPAGWRSATGQGGGVLWDLGNHHFDAWRLFSGGEPRELRVSGDEDTLALTARTDDGVVLSTTLVAGAGAAHEIELVGDRGRLTLPLYRGDGPHFAAAGAPVGGPRVRARSALRAARALPRQVRAARAGGDYVMTFAAQWEAIRAAVRDGGGPPATLADGRAAVALAVAAQAALGSVREGAPA